MEYVLLLSIIVNVVLGLLYCDARFRHRSIQDEAVNRGHARWVETREGDIVFKWGQGWFI